MKLRYQEGTQLLAKLMIIQPKVKLTSYKCWFRRLHFTKERWESNIFHSFFFFFSFNMNFGLNTCFIYIYIYHSNTIKLRELRELRVLEPSINK